MDALDGKEGPWGGKIKVGRARGDSWKPDERQKWGADVPLPVGNQDDSSVMEC
jgi:hypothetical protein